MITNHLLNAAGLSLIMSLVIMGLGYFSYQSYHGYSKRISNWGWLKFTALGLLFFTGFFLMGL